MPASGFYVRQGHAVACQTMPRHDHQHSPFSAHLVPFSSPLRSFCSSITYKIKITCKSSQNDDKQDINTKYKRIKYIYIYNSPLSVTIYFGVCLLIFFCQSFVTTITLLQKPFNIQMTVCSMISPHFCSLEHCSPSTGVTSIKR